MDLDLGERADRLKTGWGEAEWNDEIIAQELAAEGRE
jgi:hypothetical protein